MTWDLPKEYLGVEAEMTRIDEKLSKDKKKRKSHTEETTTDILGRCWVKHSTGTEFQEDHIR